VSRSRKFKLTHYPRVEVPKNGATEALAEKIKGGILRRDHSSTRKGSGSRGHGTGRFSEAVTKLAVVAVRAFCWSLAMIFYPLLGYLRALV
jgi:hypothetical protein